MALDGDVAVLETKQVKQDNPPSQIDGIPAPKWLVDFITQQRQRASQNESLIKIADFDRMGVEDEVADKRKKLADLLDRIGNLAETRAVFIDFLQDQKISVSQEIDGVNKLIDSLKGKKGYGKARDELREYRDQLRDYEKGLGWYINEAKTATTSTLGTLINSFGKTFSFFMRNREAITNGLVHTFAGLGMVARGAGSAMGQILRFIPLPF